MNVGANTIGVTSVGANFTAQNASGAAADGDMGSMASVDITGATVGIRTSQLVSIMRSGGYFEAVVRCPPVGTNNFPFVGFASTAYLTPGSGNPLTNTTSKVGFGAAGANWHAVVANGSAVVPVDLGASFVVSDLAAILFQVDIAKGGATVTLTATNMRTGAKQTVTATTGLPAANTPLATGIKADLPNITYAYLRGETRKA